MKLIDERNHRKLELFDSTLLMVKNACSFTGTPKFVYGHFMMPHGPFIVTRDGKLKNPAETVIKKKDYYLNAYYEQIKFTNKIIVDLVNFIQKSNKKNTVIIIEGDHGFRPENNYTSPYSFNNFSSFYFPDKNYNQLYDSISPVNTFRVVLNKYFQTNLNLVRDSCIKIGEAKELF
jgi:phosphoglycerol transferase MdoB-like AlkP superfamily enzyme